MAMSPLRVLIGSRIYKKYVLSRVVCKDSALCGHPLMVIDELLSVLFPFALIHSVDIVLFIFCAIKLTTTTTTMTMMIHCPR